MGKTSSISTCGVYVILAVWMLAAATASYGQIEDPDARRVAFYRHVEPGQATMQVRVWGNVSAPGLYEVQAGTDMLELLFLAGGPDIGVDRSDVKRRTSIRLSRKTNNAWGIVFEADLDDVTDRQQPYPPIQDGDALKVEVEVRRTFGWRETLTVLGAVGTVVIIADRISRIANRN